MQSHGGPTSHATPALDREFLFWTSRGFGVVDVNYRGSSGYGRAYRDAPARRLGRRRHRGLRRRRRATSPRPARSTASGWRSAAARPAATRPSARSSSTTSSPPAPATTASPTPRRSPRDTHKFESRYLDGLIGPYPERADLYRERSPIHFVERLRAPVILFQGLEDEVVPPNQAETMVAALRANGVPHAYLAFEGEQHGFRKAETEIRCLEAELYFYGRILGFEPADELEPVEIDGL